MEQNSNRLSQGSSLIFVSAIASPLSLLGTLLGICLRKQTNNNYTPLFTYIINIFGVYTCINVTRFLIFVFSSWLVFSQQ